MATLPNYKLIKIIGAGSFGIKNNSKIKNLYVIYYLF